MSTVGSHVNCWGDVAVARQRFWLRLAGLDGDVGRECRYSFVLKDTGGELYFCNLRCFCIWSVQLATRPNLSEEDKTGVYSLTTPSGEEHQFAGIVDVARWATATAFE